jgi:divalent metal cation (Fe/Co/Zn/Cd) transporter
MPAALPSLPSAGIAWWSFSPQRSYFGVFASRSTRRAARIAGALLFALAGLVVLTSVLSFIGYREAQTSFMGVGILLAAAIVMPWLGSRKRRLAATTSSAALKADAAESTLCAYMAWIALSGLVVNALWHKPWADPVAALALIPLILREGWEAMHASRLGCDCS